MRLRTKLALSLSAVLAVLILFAAWLSWLDLRKEMKAGVASQLHVLVRYAARGVDNDLGIVVETTRAAAAAVPAAALASPESLARYLHGLPMPMGACERLVAVDGHGRALAQQPAQPEIGNEDFSDREYFQRAVATRAAVVSAPLEGRVSGEPTLIIAAPRLGPSGEVELVMQCSLYLRNERLFGELRSAPVGKTGYLYIATQDRRFVLHPDRSRILAEAPPIGMNPALDMAGEGLEGTEESANRAGVAALVSFKRVATTGWFVGAIYPLEEAYAPLAAARGRVAGITLAALLAGGLFAWLLAGLLVRPVERLTRQVGLLRERPQAVVHQLPRRKDEIGALAEAFNGLLAALREREARLRASEERFAKVFHSNPDFIMLSRLSDGLIVEVNEGFEKMTGYARAEVVGRTTADIHMWANPADRDEMAQRLRATGSVRDFVTRLVGKRGEFIDVLGSTTLIDVGGEPHLIGTARDMTEFRRTQDLLRESEARFSKAFRSNPDFIMISRKSDGLIVEVNEGFERLTGYARDEAVGRRTTDLNLWADPEDRDEMMRLLAKMGEVRDFLTRFVDRHGKMHEVLTSATIIELHGEPHVIGTSRDITELKRTQEKLRESEEKFSKAFHSNPDSIIITRQRDGRIMEVNEGFERITGYGAGEALGRTTLELRLWQGAEDRERMVRQLARTGRANDIEHIILTKQGEPRNVLSSSTMIDVGGEAHMLATSRDITKLKFAEKALRQSEERFSKVFHASPDAILVVRLSDGLILDINESFERLFGYPCAEAIGRTTVELGLWAQPERREAFRAEVRAKGRAGSHDFIARTRAGELRDMQTSSVLVDIGDVPCLISMVRDVTEQRHAEEEIRNLNVSLEHRVRERTAALEEANRELESFSYSVSHDLRSPLRAIAGYAKVIEMDYAAQIGSEGRSMLDRIIFNAVRMGELIDDMLDFARIGRAELKRSPIDMERLAREVLAELSEAGAGRRIDWRIGPMPMALADRSLVRQVWSNLLGNALKYSRQREDAVIEAGGRAEHGEAHFWVRDNGAGFDMQYSDKLFRVFQRLHRDSAFEGTGVGLAIVARVVQRHGGRVWAEGVPDEGATFHFTLPLASA